MTDPIREAGWYWVRRYHHWQVGYYDPPGRWQVGAVSLAIPGSGSSDFEIGPRLIDPGEAARAKAEPQTIGETTDPRVLGIIDGLKDALVVAQTERDAYMASYEQKCSELVKAELQPTWEQAQQIIDELEREHNAGSLAHSLEQCWPLVKAALLAYNHEAEPQREDIAEAARQRLIANSMPCPKCGADWGIIARCAAPDCPSTETRLAEFRAALERQDIAATPEQLETKLDAKTEAQGPTHKFHAECPACGAKVDIIPAEPQPSP